jgi:serine/threonine protein kinase
MIGRVFLNYQILEKLGAGGHGEVYRAFDNRLSRPVVIKILPHELTDNERNLRRFEREAQLISSLDHPNVCTVYGFDEVEGLHLMIMQLIEGRTVRQLVNGRPLRLETALRIGIQVADALATIHGRNIIHREVGAGDQYRK